MWSSASSRLVPAGIALLLLAPGGRAYQRPADPLFPWQWSLENTGQPIRRGVERSGTPDADIDGVEALAAGYTGKGVTLALIGSGFEYAGSSLEPSLWRNPDEVPGNGVDDDGNGWVDDVVGYDFGEMDADPSSAPAHDRIVSEIALAPHDEHTIAGVAPGARLMLLKTSDDRGRLLMSPLPLALRYAVKEGARVIFMPWTNQGGGCQDPALQPLGRLIAQVAEYALVIGGRPGEWPACLPDVVSVQATDEDDWPKQHPSAKIDLAAPGTDGNGNVFVSYAIGLVAGVAALVFEQDPSRSPAEVRELLLATADRVHPELAPYVGGTNQYFGAGRINASRALGTDFDGDGVVDADDMDADDDGIPDFRDPCTLNPNPACGAAPTR